MSGPVDIKCPHCGGSGDVAWEGNCYYCMGKGKLDQAGYASYCRLYKIDPDPSLLPSPPPQPDETYLEIEPAVTSEPKSWIELD